jgi:hypothetical protein
MKKLFTHLILIFFAFFCLVKPAVSPKEKPYERFTCVFEGLVNESFNGLDSLLRQTDCVPRPEF